LACGAAGKCTACGATGQICCAGSGCNLASDLCNAGGTCANRCTAGQTFCSDGCKNLTNDPLNCSACGSPCLTVANGQSTCGNSSCGFTCNAGTIRCPAATGCLATAFTFEDGTTAGWQSIDIGGLTSADDTPLATTTTRAHAGARSLTTHFTVAGARNRVEIFFPECLASTFDGRNRTLSYWVFIAPNTGGPVTGHQCIVFIDTLTSCVGCTTPTPIPAGQWTQVIQPVTDATAAAVTHLGLECTFATPGTAWTGNIFFDDGVFQ